MVRVAFPTLFSNVRVYSPVSGRITFAKRTVVMLRIVSTSMRFKSGRSASLYVHFTLGCGLPLNGISKAVDCPRLRVTVSSNCLSTNSSGGTEIMKDSFNFHIIHLATYVRIKTNLECKIFNYKL